MTPFWRWMRSVALMESHALRGYAESGRRPSRCRPISFAVLVAAGEYNPARRVETLAAQPAQREGRCRRPFAPMTAEQWGDLHPAVRACLEHDMEIYEQEVAAS